MRILILTLFLLIPLTAKLYAAQSIIVESEGYACMGDDKSRKQTELSAFQDGKRRATESAVTHISSETDVKDGMLQKDLVSAYTRAQVRVIQELMKEWYKDAGLGDCYRVRIKAEVVPEEKTMSALMVKKGETLESDPSAPLRVRIWTDRPSYSEKEHVRIYLKGNKPFYGRVIYKQADGSLVQLLPNPYRDQNYFNGGAVYEIPANGDRFDMETTAPFGTERITLYASTTPLGKIDVNSAGSVYQVVSRPADIPLGTRGVKLVPKSETGGATVPAEFDEAVAELTTKGKQ